MTFSHRDMNVCPIRAASLSVWEIWSGSHKRVYMYHIFHWLANNKDYFFKYQKTRHRTDVKADL